MPAPLPLARLWRCLTTKQVTPVELSPEALRALAIVAGLMILLATRAVLTWHRQQVHVRAQIDQVSSSTQHVVEQSAGAREILDELQRRASEQSHPVATLDQISRHLASAEPAEVLPGLLHALRSCMPLQAASVYVWHNGHLFSRAHVPTDQPAPDPGTTLSSLVVQRVLATGKPAAERAESTRPGSPLMAAPLLGADGAILGVVTVEQMPAISVCPSTVRLFEIAADLASSSLRNALLLQGVPPTAGVEALLPVLSFPLIMRRTWDEMVRARRLDQPLSLVILRIGPESDASADLEVDWQRAVAQRLCGAVRQVDGVGHHWRRDGFICVLPETSRLGAGEVVQRLVSVLHTLRGGKQPLAVWVGIASLEPGTSSAAALLATADAAALAHASTRSVEAASV
jgi:hypothetical protein